MKLIFVGPSALGMRKGRKPLKAPVAFLTNKEDGTVFPVSASDPKAQKALNSPRHREIVEKIHAGTKDPAKKAKHRDYLSAHDGASPSPGANPLEMRVNKRVLRAWAENEDVSGIKGEREPVLTMLQAHSGKLKLQSPADAKRILTSVENQGTQGMWDNETTGDPESDDFHGFRGTRDPRLLRAIDKVGAEVEKMARAKWGANWRSQAGD